MIGLRTWHVQPNVCESFQKFSSFSSIPAKIEISKYFQAAVCQDGDKITADREKTKDATRKSSKDWVQCLQRWNWSSSLEDGHKKKTSSTGPMN